MRSMVRNLIREYDPEVIGIESPAYDAGPFQTIHFGLMMFSLEAVFERRKDCVLYDPATLKFLAKSDPSKKKGPMMKLDMQRFVQMDTNDTKLIDNNEADAYCVAYFASRLKSILDGELSPTQLTPSEQKVFLLRTRTKRTLSGKKTKRVAHVFRENSRYMRFSKVPEGDVSLPKKSDINESLLEFLENAENE